MGEYIKRVKERKKRESVTLFLIIFYSGWEDKNGYDGGKDGREEKGRKLKELQW